jgi:mersacidin/lichenicidin family type 2 lantibiotic
VSAGSRLSLQVSGGCSYLLCDGALAGASSNCKTKSNNHQKLERILKMKKENIIRAWKDEAYRMSLSEAERALLPASPVGAIELSDAQLRDVTGGMRNNTAVSICHCLTVALACQTTSTSC